MKDVSFIICSVLTVVLGAILWQVSNALGVPFIVLIKSGGFLFVIAIFIGLALYARYKYKFEYAKLLYPLLGGAVWMALTPLLSYFAGVRDDKYPLQTDIVFSNRRGGIDKVKKCICYHLT
ncbi:hypothetical protein [Photobacterium indicum]|uniref:hypothetical protein n=1 Tax=Photobacterium indicum TaxID=81447 RepID=UPI003D0D7556